MRRSCTKLAATTRRLRRELEALLEASGAQGELLPPGAARLGATGAEEIAPGTRIGPYRIERPLGEGGMGRVYEASQETPVRRRVALKLIKLGMDTREVVRRFEAERQALARMDHGSIAKVFDAGATREGRPYFVMELVSGPPITAFCDGERLSARPPRSSSSPRSAAPSTTRTRRG